MDAKGEKILIFDTTLRDGEQSPGNSMNRDEKLRLARQLEKLGVDIIEAGFPVASEGDFQAIKNIAQEIRGVQVCAISRANLTDTEGRIIADSDPSLIGEAYGKDLDLNRLALSSKISWRLVSNPDGIDTFEVFRRFSPSGIPEGVGNHGRVPSPPEETQGETPTPRQVIFIGLNVGPIETARKDATRHIIMMAVLLLFIGLSGIVSLFLAQGYRSARISLSWIKAFSDSLVETMPIGLAALDNMGMVISFNQRAEAILQLAAREVIGKPGSKVLPQPFQEIIVAMDAKRGIMEKELICPLATGKTIPLEVIATELEEENGAPVGKAIIFRDLTEVQHLKREVARSQRLASIGNLAAGVAHEIRNPLSSIKGFATYFKERYRDNPDDGETADIMVQEVDRLDRVITQLLDLARPLPIEKQPVSLPLLIRQAIKVIEGQAAEKEISIRTDLATDIPEVHVDADKIKQVVLNLFLNALNAMGKGGTLNVRLSRDDGGGINLAISDTGQGIDAKNLAHIFDPYFTTKPSGSGLGLSIVHKIIEAHDGEITVASVHGKGTTFSIRLPV